MKQNIVLMPLSLNHRQAADASVEECLMAKMMEMLMMGQSPPLVQSIRMGAGEAVEETLLRWMLILSPNVSHHLLAERSVYLDLKSQTSGPQLLLNFSFKIHLKHYSKMQNKVNLKLNITTHLHQHQLKSYLNS